MRNCMAEEVGPMEFTKLTIKKKWTSKVWGASHAVWNCDVFKSRSIQEKLWATAKKPGLCYRCLGDDHLSGECPRSSV